MFNKIIHIDMDAFYASIEQRDNPQFRGKPLIVGGNPRGRGVVCTASYEARSYGINSAMPSATAKRLCPNAIFIAPNLDKYRQVSQELHKIFHEVTDIIEPISLDEAYLDVTNNKFNEPSATLLAKYIKSRIKAQLHLTASAGISSVKFVAKLASDENKPNGLTVIPPNDILTYIADLPVRKLWGVGEKTEQKLNQLGIFKVKDIRNKKRSFMLLHFGKQGNFLYDMAYGKDQRSVGEPTLHRSIGQESTFSKDLLNLEEKLLKVEHFTTYLCQQLQEKNYQIKTINVKVRFNDFTYKSKERTLPHYTSALNDLLPIAKELLLSIPDIENIPIRLLGVSAKNFWGERKGNPQQLPLL